MPEFDPELIQVMKKVLEDIMTRVPLEHLTPAAKAYFAEYILKAAAQGQSSYDALFVAAADQIRFLIFVQLGHRSLSVPHGSDRRIFQRLRAGRHRPKLVRFDASLVSAPIAVANAQQRRMGPKR